jgi:hypothetical protein
VHCLTPLSTVLRALAQEELTLFEYLKRIGLTLRVFVSSFLQIRKTKAH